MTRAIKILIISIVICLITIGIFFILKKNPFKNKSANGNKLLSASSDFVPGFSQGYNSDSLSHISTPNTPRDEYDVMIIYTGIDDVMGYKMMEKLPVHIKENYKVYYISHTDTTGENVLDYLDYQWVNEGEPRTVTIAGFSAGGKAVMRLMKDVKGRDTLRGKPIINYVLIDPSIERNFYQDLNYSKVIMTYGSNGMEGLYGNEYDVLDTVIPEDNGVIERVNTAISHYDYIAYTFNNYYK